MSIPHALAFIPHCLSQYYHELLGDGVGHVLVGQVHEAAEALRSNVAMIFHVPFQPMVCFW